MMNADQANISAPHAWMPSSQSGGCKPLEWHTVDWNKVNRNVRGYQVRIMKATKEGRWNKVRALQRLLTRSLDAKLLAVKRVTENQGKNTPGVDGEIWSTPERKSQAALSLSNRGYTPKPLRRVYIPKSNGKERPLGIPTMYDRAMQALHLLGLEPVAEVTADLNSYGFRRERSAQDATQRLLRLLSRKGAPKFILDADIKGCFDNIDHQWLLDNIPMDKSVLAAWLKAGYMENLEFHTTDAGTPQGGIISPVLANMALDGLQRKLTELYPVKTHDCQQVYLTRYADDFVITGRTKELLENEVMPVVEAFLAERGLSLSKEKTTVRHVDDGFDFLGMAHREYSGKCLVMPSKEAVKNFKNKVRAIYKEKQTAKTSGLINALNPVLVGWANYYRHVSSKHTFGQLDTWIFQKTWKWATRRHRNKNKSWLFSTYFHEYEGNRWRLFAVEESVTLHLVKMNKTRIVRHPLIKSSANPFDPECERYFEQRRHMRLKDSLTRKAKALYKEQEGRCSLCTWPIMEETGWNVHHLHERVRGGPDTLENTVLLHPNCHRQVHSQGIAIWKPAKTTEPPTQPEPGPVEAPMRIGRTGNVRRRVRLEPSE